MSRWKSAERREMLEEAIDVEACSVEVAKVDINFCFGCLCS